MTPRSWGKTATCTPPFTGGHSTNCQSQLDRIKRALEKVDLLVDIDPFVTTTSILPDRPDGVYILPAATVYEQYGSVTNSNRDIQWRKPGSWAGVGIQVRPGHSAPTWPSAWGSRMA